MVFGSNRPGGHGRGDIYIATPDAAGGWRVDNAGPPVNSAANELEAEISRDGSVLVLVANRDTLWHLYLYERSGNTSLERGRLPADDKVFQVGPLLSPTADKLLFAQATAQLSGELFVVDLIKDPDASWPPACGAL